MVYFGTESFGRRVKPKTEKTLTAQGVQKGIGRHNVGINQIPIWKTVDIH